MIRIGLCVIDVRRFSVWECMWLARLRRMLIAAVVPRARLLQRTQSGSSLQRMASSGDILNEWFELFPKIYQFYAAFAMQVRSPASRYLRVMTKLFNNPDSQNTFLVVLAKGIRTDVGLGYPKEFCPFFLSYFSICTFFLWVLSISLKTCCSYIREVEQLLTVKFCKTTWIIHYFFRFYNFHLKTCYYVKS